MQTKPTASGMRLTVDEYNRQPVCVILLKMALYTINVPRYHFCNIHSDMSTWPTKPEKHADIINSKSLILTHYLWNVPEHTTVSSCRFRAKLCVTSHIPTRPVNLFKDRLNLPTYECPLLRYFGDGLTAPHSRQAEIKSSHTAHTEQAGKKKYTPRVSSEWTTEHISTE